jgi:hypothetical protein
MVFFAIENKIILTTLSNTVKNYFDRQNGSVSCSVRCTQWCGEDNNTVVYEDAAKSAMANTMVIDK